MTTTTEKFVSQDEAVAALAKHSWNVISWSDPDGNLGDIKPNTPLTISYSK